jgi:hypothetical protein
MARTGAGIAAAAWGWGTSMWPWGWATGRVPQPASSANPKSTKKQGAEACKRIEKYFVSICFMTRTEGFFRYIFLPGETQMKSPT